MVDRSSDFESIALSLENETFQRTPRGVVAHGDSLALIKQIPDSSISLVLTDPPYHSTKKDNIYGDTAFKEDEQYITWMREFAIEFARILRPNGALYLFCATEMSARLEVAFSEFLKPLNHITWTKPNDPGFDGWKGKMNKESLKRWYPHSERILYFEQNSSHSGHRSTLGQFLREVRLESGLSAYKLTEIIGEYGAVNHGGAVSNWEIGRNVPSREQYKKIAEALLGTGKINEMPQYEDIVRPFQMNGDLDYTDVWDFPSVRPYRGKHPAEKPLDMLTHIVQSSTYEGDVILDCFSGSGSTGVAAIQLNRQAVLIDIEEQWVQRAAHRIKETEPISPKHTFIGLLEKKNSRKRTAGDTLFD